METTWKFILKAAGAPQARRLTRDVEALTASMRGLSSVASSTQAAMSRIAPAGTAGQIRGVTTAIREQTRALRELQGLSGRSRTPRAGGLPIAARVPGASAPARAPVGTPSGRVELDAGFQTRARALQVAHFQRTQREAERAQGRAARSAERARSKEEKDVAKHFADIFNSAKKNQRDLDRLNDRARRHNERMRVAGLRHRADTSAAHSETIMGMLGTAGGIGGGIVAGALAAATAIAGIGLSAGRAGLQVLAFRENTLAALTAVTGSSTDASASFQRAIQIANQTPLNVAEVVTAMTQFRVAGFNAQDTEPLLAAFTDISAARGNEAGQAFQRVVAQIRGLGRVNRGDIQQQALTAGLSPQDIYDSIARQMHLGTGATGRQAAEARVSHRQVNSDVGLQAFIDATRQAYDNHGQGQAGSFATGASRTITGALSNLSDAPTNLLLQLNTMQSPGIIAFKNAILALTGAFDVTQPAGRAMLGVIERITNVVGGMLGRINPASIAAAFTSISAGVSSVGRFITSAMPVVRAFIQGAGPGFMAAVAPMRALFAQLMAGGGPSAATMTMIANAARGLGFILGGVAGALVTIVAAGTAFFGGISAAVLTGIGLIGNIAAQFTIAFQSVGSGIVNGIIAGIRAGVGALRSAVVGLGSTAVSAVRGALGIHSPSRVFADLIGAQIPAGIAMGVTANAGLANDAVAGIVNPRVPQLGGGGGSASIVIHVNGASQPAETARAVRAELEDALGGIFGQWAEATP